MLACVLSLQLRETRETPSSWLSCGHPPCHRASRDKKRNVAFFSFLFSKERSFSPQRCYRRQRQRQRQRHRRPHRPENEGFVSKTAERTPTRCIASFQAHGNTFRSFFPSVWIPFDPRDPRKNAAVIPSCHLVEDILRKEAFRSLSLSPVLLCFFSKRKL